MKKKTKKVPDDVELVVDQRLLLALKCSMVVAYLDESIPRFGLTMQEQTLFMQARSRLRDLAVEFTSNVKG
jgi:hypothetical protein